ncbi:uncharacterized protein LOC131233301 isoform X2 [Magnolia sinica]|uniref:uncharacterized protein LOC131233301 isoform X2 n=1 Tax=Magnolia sinica TaxID=86752 RepID=UPI00265B1DBB|nr:uncharacterized protein LOC131233301 isoform X2 [Magnolia sinica]
MGKETEIWDDSALINAFDNAISKYKKMHSGKYQVNPADDEKVTSSDNEIGPNLTVDARIMELDGNSSNVSNSATETYPRCNDVGASDQLPSIQENHLGAESSASQPFIHASSSLPVQETFEGYSDIQGEEYRKLLGQYYELEEQRQRVLQQLHQASGWNYQPSSECSGSCVPCYMCCSTSQAHEVTTHSTSCPVHFSCCCPYSCHYMAGLSPSKPACDLGGQCVPNSDARTTGPSCTIDPVKLSSLADDSVFKIAMGAAEKAIASMKVTASATSDGYEGEKARGKTQSSSILDSGASQNISSETDLTEVLTAWYSAGFYTGKYLLEQSLPKSQH